VSTKRLGFRRYHNDVEAGSPQLDDPLYAQRNPFQTFLLGAALGASWPLIEGNAGSAVLERELNNAAVILWGICLGLGAAMGLAGMLWPRTPANKAWTGLVVERSGLFLVGGAGAVYAIVVWSSVNGATSDVVYPVLIQLAFCAASFWRVAQITRRMRWWRTVDRWTKGLPPEPSRWYRWAQRLHLARRAQ
jgi:hypothetical protein